MDPYKLSHGMGEQGDKTSRLNRLTVRMSACTPSSRPSFTKYIVDLLNLAVLTTQDKLSWFTNYLDGVKTCYNYWAG